MTHVEQLMQKLLVKASEEEVRRVLERLKTVLPVADAAQDFFAAQMFGTGALSADAVVNPAFADDLVWEIQEMLFHAMASDQAAIEAELPEYAFDIRLVAALRVKARSREEAVAMLREVLDAASCNAGAWPNGDPIVFEASLDGEPELYEVDGEAVN